MRDPLYDQPTYLLEDGQYAFYLYGQKLFEVPEVAILLDHVRGRVLKHGSPAFVVNEHEKSSRLHVAEGYSSDELVVIQGRFDLRELNDSLRIYGRILELYNKVQAARTASARESAEELLYRISAAAAAGVPPCV